MNPDCFTFTNLFSEFSNLPEEKHWFFKADKSA